MAPYNKLDAFSWIEQMHQRYDMYGWSCEPVHAIHNMIARPTLTLYAHAYVDTHNEEKLQFCFSCRHLCTCLTIIHKSAVIDNSEWFCDNF